MCALFLKDLHVFLRRPWVFSRANGCGARKGPTCTPRRKFGSREGSVARALGVQSREIWQVEAITGLLSAELELRKTMENLHISCFAPLLSKLSTLLAVTVQEQSHIKFVWTTTPCLLCVYYGTCVLVHAGLCIGVLEPTFQLLVFVLLCLLLPLPYHVIGITPFPELSSSLLGGSHGTRAVAQPVCADHYSLCVRWHSSWHSICV